MDEFILVELIQLRVDPVATELLRQREHAIQVFRAVMAVADEYSNGLRGPELMLMLDQREVRLVTTTSSRSGRARFISLMRALLRRVGAREPSGMARKFAQRLAAPFQFPLEL